MGAKLNWNFPQPAHIRIFIIVRIQTLQSSLPNPNWVFIAQQTVGGKQGRITTTFEYNDMNICLYMTILWSQLSII